MFYIYVLLSLKDHNFYIGYTTDLRRRWNEHQYGRVSSTQYRRPLKMVCYEAYLTKIEAMRREKFLKSSDGKKDLRKRIRESL